MILTRYIYREIIFTFLAVFGLLMTIYVSNRFVEYLADAAAGKIGLTLIIKLMALKLITSQVLILPLCVYLAIYLVYLRIYKDNEMAAISGAGLGLTYQLKVTMTVSTLFAILITVITFFIAPWAEGKLSTLEAQAKSESDITGISAGRFKEFSKGDRILYVEEFGDDNKTMKDVFLQVKQEGQLGVLTSSTAKIIIEPKTHDRFVVFTNGIRYIGTPGQKNYNITEYKAYGVRIDLGEQNLIRRYNAMPTAALLIAKDKLSKSELHWRIAIPLSCIILSCIASLIITATGRSNTYTGLLVAILIYFLYSNLLGIGKGLIRKGDVPDFIGLWWVHSVALLYPIVFYITTHHRAEINKLLIWKPISAT